MLKTLGGKLLPYFLILVLLLPKHDNKQDIINDILSSSVLVDIGMNAFSDGKEIKIFPGNQGTGILLKRNGRVYVLTNSHVVSDAGPLTVQQITDDKNLSSPAKVVLQSSPEDGIDIALLRVLEPTKLHITNYANLYLDKDIIPVGTELYHVGCLYGEKGYNSLTTGIVSKQQLIFHGHTFDQVTTLAAPGSSGGGVYLKESGRCIGLLSMIKSPTQGFIVPIRRIRDWAVKNKLEWLVNERPQEKVQKMKVQ